MRILAGEFKINKWEEQSFMQMTPPAKANAANIVYDVSGDLNGKLTGKYVMIYQNESQAQYCGALQFVGTIGEKRGSFFLQEIGIFSENMANTNWTIIEGSGRDGLFGINGSGGYSSGEQIVKFTLHVLGI